MLAQLHAEGLNAKIVDAIDGDAFTSQDLGLDLGAWSSRVICRWLARVDESALTCGLTASVW